MSDIVPFDKITTVKITSFKVDVVALQLNSSATFRVVLYGENYIGNTDNKVPIGVESILIDGDDYRQWSNDDDFVVKYIAKKLGFTLC
jgi:hypothetical protein